MDTVQRGWQEEEETSRCNRTRQVPITCENAIANGMICLSHVSHMCRASGCDRCAGCKYVCFFFLCFVYCAISMSCGMSLRGGSRMFWRGACRDMVGKAWESLVWSPFVHKRGEQ